MLVTCHSFFRSDQKRILQICVVTILFYFMYGALFKAVHKAKSTKPVLVEQRAPALAIGAAQSLHDYVKPAPVDPAKPADVGIPGSGDRVIPASEDHDKPVSEDPVVPDDEVSPWENPPIPASNDHTRSDLDVSLEQNDDRLIEYVKKNLLEPPDGKPYNFQYPKLYHRKGENPEDLYREIFQGKTGGIFFEAGAFDGEMYSTTQMLERKYNWTGLLVEGNPESLALLRTKHRKAWLAPVLLSVSNYPTKLIMALHKMATYLQPLGDVVRTYRCSEHEKDKFNLDDKALKEIMARPECVPIDNRHITQTIPLYTLLKASGFTEIDLFTLDVEGVELDVLKTLPFDKVNIKVAFIEVQLGARRAIKDIMRANGFEIIKTIKEYDVQRIRWRDLVCIKKGILEPGTYTIEP